MKEREQAREDELFRPRSVAGSFSSEHGGRHALSQSWFKKKLLAESSEGSDEDPQAQSRQEASSFSSPRRQNAASFSSPRKSVASQKPRQHTSEASPPKEKEPGSPKQTRTGSFNGKPVSRPGSFGASFGGTFARAQALTSTTADKWNAEPHDDIVRPQLATLQPQNPSPSPTAPAATAPAPETSAPAPAPAPAQEVQVVDVGELGEWLPSELKQRAKAVQARTSSESTGPSAGRGGLEDSAIEDTQEPLSDAPASTESGASAAGHDALEEWLPSEVTQLDKTVPEKPSAREEVDLEQSVSPAAAQDPLPLPPPTASAGSKPPASTGSKTLTFSSDEEDDSPASLFAPKLSSTPAADAAGQQLFSPRANPDFINALNEGLSDDDDEEFSAALRRGR